MAEYVSTIRMPTEYERAAAEARRRQRMAEMLSAQEYDPTVYQNAPIPAAAPLVQGLQAFLKARAGRTADEALEKAEAADVSAMRDLFTRLGPQERTGAEAAVQDIAQSAQMGQLGRDGTYTPSTIMPSNQPVGMPFTEAAPTGQERKDILMAAAASGSPRASKLAELMLAQKEEKPELPYSKVNLAELSPSARKAFVASVEAGKPDFSLVEPIGITPQQQRQYELDLARFGIDQAQANLARAKAADEGIDVSSMRIPGFPSLTSAVTTPQPVAVPTMPTRTPGEMRMQGFEEAVPRPVPPRPVGPRPPVATPLAATMAAPTERKRVPLIENPQIAPFEKRKLMLDEPQAKARASSTQSEIQSLIDMANDLINHPGLAEITGKLGQYEITDLSPEAREARGIYNALKDKTALLKTAMVREANKTGGAFGNMTEQEWPRLESAFGNISNAQDVGGLQESLQNYITNVNGMGEANKGIYEDTYGTLQWKPREYKPKSAKYKRKGQSAGSWGRATVVPD